MLDKQSCQECWNQWQKISNELDTKLKIESKALELAVTANCDIMIDIQIDKYRNQAKELI